MVSNFWKLLLAIVLQQAGTNYFELVNRIDDDEPANRIVGGFPVQIENVPYQVSIQLDGQHICGGIIISDKHVLSAAHCFAVRNMNRINVRVGSTYHYSGGFLVAIRHLNVHPGFNSPYSFDNDIAILTLDKRLTFGPKIQQLSLPCQNETILPGSKLLTSGWGTFATGQRVSDFLNAVIVTAIDHRCCKAAYNFHGLAVTNNMICAGDFNTPKDACQGDSGGPMVSKDKKLVGIVSWGYICGMPQMPGVYTDVAKYRDFIAKYTGLCKKKPKSFGCHETELPVESND